MIRCFGVLLFLLVSNFLLAQTTVIGTGTDACDQSGNNSGITTDLTSLKATATNAITSDCFSIEENCGIKLIPSCNGNNTVEIVTTQTGFVCGDYDYVSDVLYAGKANGDIWKFELVAGVWTETFDTNVGSELIEIEANQGVIYSLHGSMGTIKVNGVIGISNSGAIDIAHFGGIFGDYLYYPTATQLKEYDFSSVFTIATFPSGFGNPIALSVDYSGGFFDAGDVWVLSDLGQIYYKPSGASGGLVSYVSIFNGDIDYQNDTLIGIENLKVIGTFADTAICNNNPFVNTTGQGLPNNETSLKEAVDHICLDNSTVDFHWSIDTDTNIVMPPALNIEYNITFNGNGTQNTIIDASQLELLFQIALSKTLTLSNLTLQNIDTLINIGGELIINDDVLIK